jgi:hypothetical protein
MRRRQRARGGVDLRDLCTASHHILRLDERAGTVVLAQGVLCVPPLLPCRVALQRPLIGSLSAPLFRKYVPLIP